MVEYKLLQIDKMLVVMLIAMVKAQLIINESTLSEADFTTHISISINRLQFNMIGYSVKLKQIQSYLNSTLFQRYILNSNINGQLTNNWSPSFYMPQGTKYNCQAYKNASDPNSTVDCQLQLRNESQLLSKLGSYVWNTTNQPNWAIQIKIDDTDLRQINQWYQWMYFLLDIYKNSYYIAFEVLIDQADRWAQLGYKQSYSFKDFIVDIKTLEMSTSGFTYAGPGLTMNASKQEWILPLQTFFQFTSSSYFTVRCVIFNSSNITIDSLLSSHATRQFLFERFRINSTFGYTYFDKKVGLSDVRLVDGTGVPGVTNSFAAAIWAIQFLIEAGKMNIFRVNFNNDIYPGNKQGMFDDNLKPTSLYYAMLLGSILIQGSPKVIHPHQKIGLSSKIKVYGLSTRGFLKVVILNKDTNASLSGTVRLRSSTVEPMSCYYLEAPSLTATDNISIAGYTYIAGNSSPQGNYTIFSYNKSEMGYYEIPIKYAQVAYCKIKSQPTDFPRDDWQTDNQLGTPKYQILIPIVMLCGVFLLLMIRLLLS